MTPKDRLLCLLAAKFAQRRPLDELAEHLGVEPRLTWLRLVALQEEGLVKTWPDGQFGLTSAGNLRRNELTAGVKS